MGGYYRYYPAEKSKILQGKQNCQAKIDNNTFKVVPPFYYLRDLECRCNHFTHIFCIVLEHCYQSLPTSKILFVHLLISAVSHSVFSTRKSLPVLRKACIKCMACAFYTFSFIVSPVLDISNIWESFELQMTYQPQFAFHLRQCAWQICQLAMTLKICSLVFTGCKHCTMKS